MSHSLRQNMDMTDASPTLDLVPGRSYYEEEEEGWGTRAASSFVAARTRARSVLLGLPRVTCCLSLLALHAQPVIPRPWPQRERAARSLNGRDSRFSSTRQPFSQHEVHNCDAGFLKA